jgi:hypothetical protein
MDSTRARQFRIATTVRALPLDDATRAWASEKHALD